MEKGESAIRQKEGGTAEAPREETLFSVDEGLCVYSVFG